MNGIDPGNFQGNGYQLAYGLSSKLAVTATTSAESRNFNIYNGGVLTSSISGVSFNSTAIGLQYKLSDHIAISAGSLKSEFTQNLASYPSTETFGAIAYKGNISKNLGSYASYLKSTNVATGKLV